MKRTVLALTLVLLLAGLLASGVAAQDDYLDAEPYRIQPGDTLSSIARDACTTWQDVFRLNAGYIGDDPNALRAGTLIYVIDRCDANTVHDRGPSFHAAGTVNGNVYTVAAGDTLYSIGQRFGLNYQVIMAANGLTSTAVLNPGAQLVIPGLNVGHAPPAIVIAGPAEGIFHSPYTVTGTGQSLYENNVVVRLLDNNGNLIAQQATVMQSAEVGGPGRWQVQFPNVFIRPNTPGRVEAFNPETGATAVTNVLFAGY